VRRKVIASIVWKDVTVVWRNRGARLPMLIVPIVLLVFLPALLLGGMLVTGAPIGDLDGWTRYVVERVFLPGYLVVPLLVAMVIATDSIAGERERGTLEGLLHSPASDDELLLGKILAAWLPAVVIGGLGFLAYATTTNLVAWPVMGEVFFPNLLWVVVALWCMPAIAALGLGIMVFVSLYVNSVRAAHQVAALIVIPVVLLIVVPMTAAFSTGNDALLAGCILWVVVAAIGAFARTRVRRDALAQRL
jgi:ABC-2 type transport system permease protein